MHYKKGLWIAEVLRVISSNEAPNCKHFICGFKKLSGIGKLSRYILKTKCNSKYKIKCKVQNKVIQWVSKYQCFIICVTLITCSFEHNQKAERSRETNHKCNTLTPQIKGKCHCTNVILHWLWNVNKIYALISVRISLRHSTNPSNCLMTRWNYCALHI